MSATDDLDQTLGNWLSEGPNRLPSNTLEAIVQGVRDTNQRRSAWLPRRETLNRFVVAAGSLTAVALVVLIGLGLATGRNSFGPGVPPPASSTPTPSPTPSPSPSPSPSPTPAQPLALAGTWETTDGDGSRPTMALVALPNGTYNVTIRDDLASVCGGAASTMTGVAETKERGTIVIAQPEFVCDDGSQPQALSGPPLEEQLRDFSFTYDSQRDSLQDSFGAEWNRVEPATQQPGALVGNWEATDPPPDSSHLTLAIVELPNGTYEVTIHDDLASVCSGAASTMTGVAKGKGRGTIVIAQPAFVCDDGSEAQALSGPPLEEQLRDFTFTYDTQGDILQDSFGLEWNRIAAAPTP